MIAPLSAMGNGNSRSPRAKALLVESPRHLEGYALRRAFRFVGCVAGFDGHSTLGPGLLRYCFGITAACATTPGWPARSPAIGGCLFWLPFPL